MAKVRLGFVSNSSSSSFIIRNESITAKQLNQIKNYTPGYHDDSWTIHVYDDAISGFTCMDNGSLGEFFKKIGVYDVVEWESD